jgi:hypothetical protein
MGKITDLDDLAKRRNVGSSSALIGAIARRNGITRRPGSKGAVVARLEHGRWLADCPFCGGAELVSRVRAEFFCLNPECGMAENDGMAMRAVFPGQREEIEQLVEGRPAPNRNWRPGETVAGIKKENKRHGVK